MTKITKKTFFLKMDYFIKVYLNQTIDVFLWKYGNSVRFLSENANA
jgi:hypothetical protein